MPPTQLRDVALYQVRPALSRVPGVGPITVTAGEEREVEVEVDPARAEAAGLTVDEIAQRLADANRFATVGRARSRLSPLRHRAARQRALDARELGDFVVGGSDRAPVRLGDVARIGEGHADPRLLVRSPRGPAAVVNVARRIGGDVVALDAALARALGRAAPRAAARRRAHAGLPAGDADRRAPPARCATRSSLGALLSALVMLRLPARSRAPRWSRRWRSPRRCCARAR